MLVTRSIAPALLSAGVICYGLVELAKKLARPIDDRVSATGEEEGA
jgi:hypothetical protein